MINIFTGLNPFKMISAYKDQAKKYRDLSAAEQKAYNDPILEWSSYLNQEFHKTSRWYFYASLILAALVVYGLLTNQWSFSAALLVCAGVYYYVTHTKGPIIEVKLSETGLQVGERVYPFTDLRTFWVEYNPPYSQYLHLVLKNTYKQDISVQIHQVEVTQLRTILSRYLPEWKEREKSFTEHLAQTLGL